MADLIYMGTIDDVVDRYPWNFKVDKARLEHSLAIQLITGSPILLNDGYLVMNKIVRQAIMNKEGLIWQMMEKGYLKVMARGKGKFSLDQMPSEMGERGGVSSFKELTNDKTTWTQLKKALKTVDDKLTSSDNILPWPKFDSSSGFLLFSDHLLRKSNAEKVGLSPYVTDVAFADFLKIYIERLHDKMKAPRTIWEDLAIEFANNINSSRQKRFLRTMMNLANEIYHYNMGVMISADRNRSIAVETQVSSAFDDLLVIPKILYEQMDQIHDIQPINVPRSVLTASPAKLIQVLDPDLPVGQARERWRKYQSNINQAPLDEIKEARKEYQSLLVEHLGGDISFKESEGFTNWAFSRLTSDMNRALAGGAAALGFQIGSMSGIPKLGPGMSLVAGIATGYLVSRYQKKILGTVMQKFKIYIFKNQIEPPEMFSRSMNVITQIKTRQAPSTIEINLSEASRMAKEMKRFE